MQPSSSDPSSTLRVMDYASSHPINPYATPALILGVIGLIVPFIPSTLALVLGRRGVRVANQTPRSPGRAMSKVATGLGVIGLVISIGMAIAVVPFINASRRQILAVSCLGNMRQIAIGAQMYASQNRGHLPESLDQLATNGIIATVFTCPACTATAGKPIAFTGVSGSYNYHYLGAGRKMSDIRNPNSVPLAFEPSTNHDGRSINVAFVDGHAATFTGAAMTTFLAANPPPATQPAPATTQTVEQ